MTNLSGEKYDVLKKAHLLSKTGWEPNKFNFLEKNLIILLFEFAPYITFIISQIGKRLGIEDFYTTTLDIANKELSTKEWNFSILRKKH